MAGSCCRRRRRSDSCYRRRGRRSGPCWSKRSDACQRRRRRSDSCCQRRMRSDSCCRRRRRRSGPCWRKRSDACQRRRRRSGSCWRRRRSDSCCRRRRRSGSCCRRRRRCASHLGRAGSQEGSLYVYMINRIDVVIYEYDSESIPAMIIERIMSTILGVTAQAASLVYAACTSSSKNPKATPRYPSFSSCSYYTEKSLVKR